MFDHDFLAGEQGKLIHVVGSNFRIVTEVGHAHTQKPEGSAGFKFRG